MDGKQLFIISEFDQLIEQIEQDHTNLEIYSHGSSSFAYKDQLDEWLTKLSLMQNTLEKLLDVQKQLLSLDPLFCNELVQNSLTSEHKNYNSYMTQF